MNTFQRTAIAGLALATIFSALPAFAEIVAYKAALSGTEEVPSTTSKGTGAIEVTFDSATMKLAWKGSYASLTGAATAAHFHGPAEAGKNAGVEVPVPAAASPFEGSATLTDAQASDLIAGKLYFNVHTAANPNGEIRGQIAKAK